MTFEVGETVVYPHHGAARIIDIRQRKVRGEEKTYLQLEVAQGDLTILVPADSVDLIGVRDVVDQQFEVAGRILAKGLVPIIEPEVDIHAPDKAEAEELLIAALTGHLDALPDGGDVMLKVTIPSVDGRYGELMKHPRVMRVVALSGGYEREDANARLARNPGLIASFSRALLEGLSDAQSQEEFDATLDSTIEAVYRASVAG